MTLVSQREAIDASAPTVQATRVPLGPTEKYEPSTDLLTWMREKFNDFGDIYKANIYGTDVYVASTPEYAHHVLQRNWQNYRKGHDIKRVGFLLGNGLMVSEGKMWKSQRRLIQPVFHHEKIGALMNIITTANIELLNKWRAAAEEKR